MQQRRRVQVCQEVVRGLEGEANIGDVERCRDPVSGHVADPQRWQEDGRHRQGDGQANECRGQQPARSARVETDERERARLCDLANDQAGDQETGQDEEDIHADEPA